MATAAKGAASERGDTPAAVALFVATGHLTLAEPRDSAAAAASYQPTHATAHITDHGDRPALAGANSAHYEVYSNGGTGGPIDYSRPIALTTNTTWITPPLAPGSWSFAVRSADANGLELNLTTSTTIVIGPDGRDATNLPAPPVGLTVAPAKGAQLVAHWTYPPLIAGDPKAPQGFRLYLGSPGPDYSRPAAAIAADTPIQGIYRAALTGLVDGTTYAVAVRAGNAAGEEANTTTVTITARGTGPLAVTGLTATAI